MNFKTYQSLSAEAKEEYAFHYMRKNRAWLTNSVLWAVMFLCLLVAAMSVSLAAEQYPGLKEAGEKLMSDSNKFLKYSTALLVGEVLLNTAFLVYDVWWGWSFKKKHVQKTVVQPVFHELPRGRA